MKKVESKVNFDLSVLNLSELIKTYETIINFLQYLEDKKIVIEEESNE
jgi:hypothetical protein